jgi:predicted outer membrane repeat protein
LTLKNCVVRNNHAIGGSTASGAGVYVNQSQLTTIDCTFDSNSATGNGGGIYNVGSTLIVNGCTLSSNSALNGGGIYNASGTTGVTGSLIYANTATHGGGIANVGTLGLATLTMSNCTVSSNIVSGSSATGSQIHNARQLTNASATIGNSTLVSDKVAPTYSGGALYNDNGGSVTIGNSIIQAGVQEHTIVNTGSSTIISAGYNLAFDNGSGLLTGSGDQINTDPLLDLGTGPRDNGGPTFTIALKAGSPAIDKGKRDAISMLPAATDQRGQPRPFEDPGIANATGGDGSDIGAYEAGLRLTAVVRMVDDLQFSFTTIVGKNYQLQTRSNLVTGNWTSLGGIIAGNGGIVPLTAGAVFSPPVQFYRVIQSP